MNATAEKPAQPRRRGFRFSLRTLLILVTVLSVPLGWVGWKLREVRREQATIDWIEEMGGEASFHSQHGISWWKKTTNKWFGERVASVSLPNTQVSDLSPLAELKSLKWLFLNSTQVGDLSPLAELMNLKRLSLNYTQVGDLSPLAGLKNLKTLILRNSQVSDEQVQELRQALPNCKIEHSIRAEKGPTIQTTPNPPS